MWGCQRSLQPDPLCDTDPVTGSADFGQTVRVSLSLDPHAPTAPSDRGVCLLVVGGGGTATRMPVPVALGAQTKDARPVAPRYNSEATPAPVRP